MFPTPPPNVICRMAPSPARRLFALFVLYALAGIVLWLTLTLATGLVWQLPLLAFAGGTLWIAEKMRRATRLWLDVTEMEVRDASGAVLARIDEIENVERGLFAFKPANGFLLVLKERQPRHWAPGLWWRSGRRVGVGGVTSRSEARMMAEQIALLVNRARA